MRMAMRAADAFRRCANLAQRRHQISLIERLGTDLGRIVSRSLVYTALEMARKPARAAGLEDLQAFLERGFHAFRHMQGSEDFVHIIVDRKTRILERIFDGHASPFDLPAGASPS